MRKNKLFNIKFIILTLILLFITSTFVSNGNLMSKMNLDQMQLDKRYSNEYYYNSVKKRVEKQLINEVDTYIKTEFPHSKINSKCLVEKCLKYDVDIVFVLSQGIVESHLGTKGRAMYTNSVWNVGTFDNGKVMYTYKTADESIEPYLILLKDKYLTHIIKKGNKTDTVRRDINSILQKGYYNSRGNRFAASRKYEQFIMCVMQSINNKTSISLYQSVLKLDREKLLSSFSPNQKDI